MFEGAFNNYRYLEFIESKDPEEIKTILRSITLPFNIVAMYIKPDGTHVAWLRMNKNYRKQSKEKQNLKE